MDKIQILIFAAAIAILAVRLYQKYMKKNKGKSGPDVKLKSSSALSPSAKDDDYEPYSKK